MPSSTATNYNVHFPKTLPNPRCNSCTDPLYQSRRPPFPAQRAESLPYAGVRAGIVSPPTRRHVTESTGRGQGGSHGNGVQTSTVGTAGGHSICRGTSATSTRVADDPREEDFDRRRWHLVVRSNHFVPDRGALRCLQPTHAHPSIRPSWLDTGPARDSPCPSYRRNNCCSSVFYDNMQRETGYIISVYTTEYGRYFLS